MAGAIKSQVNFRDFQIKCARVLHETLVVPVLTYLLRSEKERSRIRSVQMDSFKDLLGISGMDRVPNARIRELCGVTKGEDERIDEDVLWCFAHVERIYKERIVKRVYVGEFAGSRSVGRPRKR